jgi:hypothetical protein
MDIGFHLTTALDRIREGQLQQNMLLDAIVKSQGRTNEALAALLNSKNGAAYMPMQASEKKTSNGPLPILSNPDAQALLKWLVGGLSLLIVLKGGDAKTVLDLVSKFF